MSRAGRGLLTTLLVPLAIFAAWRIGSDAIATQQAAADPERALRIRPDLPVATRTLLSRDAGLDHAGPVRHARAVLAREPLEGWAFATIAAGATPSAAAALHRVAARRAPRLIRPRVWLVNHDLRARRYRDAMHGIDVLLRLSPPYREHLYPRLVQLSGDPAFVGALAETLGRNPLWREEFVGTLDGDDPHGARRALMSRLAQLGMLTVDERDRWIDRLLAGGHWADAYGVWAGTLVPLPSRVPAVYNGSFDTPPSDRGFDWRMPDTPGAQLDFSEAKARITFPGRPAADAGLEHALYLGPGHYRLHARMRVAGLQGLDGLQWTVACGDRNRVLARSRAFSGTFEWRDVAVNFEVPATGCSGQWLRLQNPAPAGAAQVLSGEVWLDDVSIRVLHRPAAAAVATLRGAATSVLRTGGADFVRASAGSRLAEGDRLTLVSPAPVTVAYRGGCEERLRLGTVYIVREASCGRRVGPQPGLRDRPPADVAVLPQAESWPLPPIGR